MNSYTVTLESKTGDIFTHMCMCSSKREASIASIREVEENEKLIEKNFVVIDVSMSTPIENVKYVDTTTIAEVLMGEEKEWE